MTPIEVLNPLDEAGEIVEQYAQFLADQAFNRRDREEHGEGCGCIRCKRDAEVDALWAIGFMNHEEPEEPKNIYLLPPGWKSTDDLDLPDDLEEA